MESGIFWKKLVHSCNKGGVEGGKNLRNQQMWRMEMCVEGGFFFQNLQVTFTRGMRETLEGWTRNGLVSGRLQVKKLK